MVKHYLNYLFIVTKPDILVVISRLLCTASKELHQTSYCRNMMETTKFVNELERDDYCGF